MTRKHLRSLFCAAAAAVFGAYGTAAQAIVYDIGFDPFNFAGVMQINVNPPCFFPFPADNTCNFDVLSVHFTDTLNRSWTISGPELGIGNLVRVDATDKLIGVDVDIFGVQPVGFEINCGDGATLRFQLAANFQFGGPVTFDCGRFENTGTVTTITLAQVPEPATLALLGLGLSGLALTRRRKPN